MSITNIRTAIASAVNSTIHCTAVMPTIINPPCAFPVPKSGNWNVTMPRQVDNVTYELWVILGRQGVIEESQTRLDDLLDSGAIKAAVEGGSYGTSASFVQVTGWHDYGSIRVNETEYIGVRFDIITK